MESIDTSDRERAILARVTVEALLRGSRGKYLMRTSFGARPVGILYLFSTCGR